MEPTKERESVPPADRVAVGGDTLVRNTLLNLAGQVLPLIVGLAVIPYVIRGLGTDRFGVLTLCWVLLGYLGIFQLGLGPAVTKHAAELFGRKDAPALVALLGSSMRLSAVLGIAASAFLGLLAPLLAERVFRVPPNLVGETRTAFLLLSAAMPFLFVAGTARGFLAAAQRFGVVNAVWAATTSLNYLVPAAAVLLGRGLGTVLLVILASRAVAALLLYVSCRRLVGPAARSPRPIRSPIAPLLRFGGWVTVSNATNPILSHLERFLIASFLSVGLLAYYATPYEMIVRAAALPAAFALTLFPAFSFHGPQNRETVLRLFSHSLKWLFLLMVPVTVFFVAFGGALLSLWLGGDFAEKSTLLFRILAVSFFFHAFAYVPLSVVQGFGRPDLKAKLDLFEVPLFALLLFLLLPRAGLEGAALAKLLITLVDVAFLFLFARRLLGFRTASFRGRTTLLLGGAVLAYVALSAMFAAGVRSAPLGIGAWLVATAGYAVVAFRWGANARDREVLRAVALRLRGGGTGR
ncbi:MAG: flippase [Candidatus Eisenbacteria bacterium]|nr:flippase [Candidatus Eisenbacteria bacterium]